jgi:threonine synthase
VPFSYLSHLECPRCGAAYDADVPQNLCACGSPLLARYDLDGLQKSGALDRTQTRPPTLWRYHELLPVRDPDNVTTLGEGMTPIVPLPRAGARIGLPRLRMKDEGLIPTGSFKARGAAVGVSRARELGIERVAMPTNGNAGAAWAAYGARAGIGALVVMPVDAPEITRRECAAAGAELYLVDGLIADAGAIVADAVAGSDRFDVSTLREPYRLEGKKTMGLEIVEQLGGRTPDAVLYPTGGGVGLIGIHKALLELRALGRLDGDLPRLVAVQASGCAPIVRAFERGERTAEPWEDAHTVAFGINVARPIGDRLMLDAIADTRGCAIAVDDDELLAAVGELAREEGAFVCPEGAANLAAARRLRESGWLSGDDDVLLLNTGAGLKYPGTVTASPPVLPRGARLPASG